MPSGDQLDRYGLVAIAVLAVVPLLYSALVLQRVLYGVSFVLPLLLLYLVWRLVRAHERIADALRDETTTRRTAATTTGRRPVEQQRRPRVGGP